MDPSATASETSTDQTAWRPASATAHRPLYLRTWSSVLLAILAGAIFFVLYWTLFPVYHVPENLLRPFPTEEDAVAREHAKDWARSMHASAGLAILGTLLAGIMAAGEWRARRMVPRRGLTTVLASALFVGLLGAAGGMIGAQLAIRLEPIEAVSSMARTVLSHGVMLGLLGCSVGLAWGLVARDRRTLSLCLGAGLLMGLIAAVAFPVLTALVLPSVQSDSIIPDGSGGVFGCVNRPGTIGVAVWSTMIAVAVGLIPAVVNRSQR